MAGKAAGPDGWSPDPLTRLPDTWWDAFAALWQSVWESSVIPDRWLEARVCLLPKDDKSYRPLSILNIAWRIGARHINRSLKRWILSWATHECLGGIPGGSVQGARARLMQSLRDRRQLIVGQDLAKFFDHIVLDHLTLVLQHLGAPTGLVDLLHSFYSKTRRLFSVQGISGMAWHSVNRGVVQGCPRSPTLAAAIVIIWC